MVASVVNEFGEAKWLLLNEMESLSGTVSNLRSVNLSLLARLSATERAPAELLSEQQFESCESDSEAYVDIECSEATLAYSQQVVNNSAGFAVFDVARKAKQKAKRAFGSTHHGQAVNIGGLDKEAGMLPGILGTNDGDGSPPGYMPNSIVSLVLGPALILQNGSHKHYIQTSSAATRLKQK